jgi:hypothetical protein
MLVCSPIKNSAAMHARTMDQFIGRLPKAQTKA